MLLVQLADDMYFFVDVCERFFLKEYWGNNYLYIYNTLVVYINADELGNGFH